MMLNKSDKIQFQIDAINRRLKSGKCSKEYSALGKIKELKRELEKIKDRERVNNWLSQ